MQQPSKAPSPPQTVVITPGAALTAQDVRGLRVKLADLRRELQNAAERRRTISEQLGSADVDSRPGLLQRLSVLDQRIVSIENDISATGLQLRNAPAAVLAETADPGPREAMELANRLSGDIIPIVAILSVFVFAPFAIALSRFIWKRSIPASRPAVSTVSDHATQQRLEQLQQSVDTIAIEVERISEGQRFVTKVLADRDRALGAGAAEPVRASHESTRGK